MGFNWSKNNAVRSNKGWDAFVAVFPAGGAARAYTRASKKAHASLTLHTSFGGG